MSDERCTAVGEEIWQDGIKLADCAGPNTAAVIVAQLNRLDAAEALIVEMREALEHAAEELEYHRSAVACGRMPDVTAVVEAACRKVEAAKAKAEAWEASRAD